MWAVNNTQTEVHQNTMWKQISKINHDFSVYQYQHLIRVLYCDAQARRLPRDIHPLFGAMASAFRSLLLLSTHVELESPTSALR